MRRSRLFIDTRLVRVAAALSDLLIANCLRQNAALIAEFRNSKFRQQGRRKLIAARVLGRRVARRLVVSSVMPSLVSVLLDARKLYNTVFHDRRH